MKPISIFIFFLILTSSQAQVTPLEDHTWRLEKIVTADSTLVVPDNITTQATFNSNNYSFGNCISFVGTVTYTNSNQDFQFNDGGVPISPECDPELFLIDEFYVEEFLFDQPFVSFFNPFSYSFTTQNNTIYLDITNSEGSVATFYDNLLGKDEFLRQNVKIYPNPVVDNLFIESNQSNIQKLLIYDLSGRIVLKQEGLENNQLDVSNLRQGIYILKIHTSGGVIQRKLIKK